MVFGRPPIKIEGYREFQRQVSRAADRDIPKAIGQAHKRVGQLVISRIQPKPSPATVGAGAGSTIRPSATRREVILRVGGAHRDNPPAEIWGKRYVTRPQSGRPHIIGTAEKHEGEITDYLLDELERVLKPRPFL